MYIQSSLIHQKHKVSSQLDYSPTIKSQISTSKVPENTQCITEIVINSHNLRSIKECLRNVIEILLKDPHVVHISSENYDGALGSHKIYIYDLMDK